MAAAATAGELDGCSLSESYGRRASPPQRVRARGCRLLHALPLVLALLVGRSSAQPTFRFGSISWAACDTPFADPYFPHVCRTAQDADGKFEAPHPRRIAVTVHAAWSKARTTESTMISNAQATASANEFELNGAPTWLGLSRLQEQPKYERRVGYRRGKGSGSMLVDDDSLCVTGDDVGKPACSSNVYGFMIDRLSPDKQIFHARYTFEITFPGNGDYEVFFEGCCRLSSIDNNANLPFYLSGTPPTTPFFNTHYPLQHPPTDPLNTDCPI